MRHRRGPVLAILAALSLAGFGAAAQPAAAASASLCPWWFYDNESFFANGGLGSTTAAGEIVKCRRITLDDDGYPAGTRAWQVLYRSTTDAGTPMAVGGTVIVPATAARGIVSMASGTVGLRDKNADGDSCAPSVGLPTGEAQVSSAAVDYVERGFAVAVTDYEGLRTPGHHPYLNGRSAAQAVIDMARAARVLPYAGLSGKKVLFLGYSQGGQASLWAAQITAAYAPGLPVVGAVAGGVPVDVRATINHLDGALFSGFLSYIITSFDRQYPSLGLSGRLSASGATFVSDHSRMCGSQATTSFAGMFRSWASLWKPGEDPLGDPAFLSALARNQMPATAPTVPLYLFHGSLDDVVPYAPARALADRWIGDHADVRWQTVLGNHILFTYDAATRGAAPWIEERFPPSAG